MSGKHRILILSVSAGTGHLRAADALEKAALASDEVSEVLHIDSLKHTNKVFRRFYGQFYIDLVKSAPALLGWFYNSQDEPWKTEKMRLMLDRMNTGPLVRQIKKFEPDITICTHFLPAEIMSYLMKKEKICTRLAVIVTDYYVHAMWLSRLFNHYFVANEESRVQLEMMGLPPGAITQSGIPIDPVFAEDVDRMQLRKQYGLCLDTPMLLVSAGALGVSSAELIVDVLNALESHVQVVVICGKNEKLQHTILKQIGNSDEEEGASDQINIRVLGYTNEMHNWMKVADLFIGKPGGLTTAEALSCGLPMLIYEPIPGQEERNSDFLLESGVAVKCNHITTMAYKVDLLLKNPERLARMRQRAYKLGHPKAAEAVIEKMISNMNIDTVVIPRPRARDKMKKRINTIKQKLKSDKHSY